MTNFRIHHIVFYSNYVFQKRGFCVSRLWKFSYLENKKCIYIYKETEIFHNLQIYQKQFTCQFLKSYAKKIIWKLNSYKQIASIVIQVKKQLWFYQRAQIIINFSNHLSSANVTERSKKKIKLNNSSLISDKHMRVIYRVT